MSADIRAISKWLNEQTGNIPRGEIAVLIQEHAQQAAEIERLRDALISVHDQLHGMYFESDDVMQTIRKALDESHD